MKTESYELNEQQLKNMLDFRTFANEEIAPIASQIDQEENIPFDIINKMVKKGYWGACIGEEYDGTNMDDISYGLLNEQVGRVCGNIRNIIGVQGMVSTSISKWGTKEQKEYWLPKMASGEVTTAFALTESNTGSDIKNIETSAILQESEYIINGSKKWITFGQRANLFLVFAKCEGKTAAFLVESTTPGLFIKPIKGLLGFRGSMLAELNFDNCRIPKDNIVGKIGFGLSHVASYGLSHGRYSTAWGCVGLAQGCLDQCVNYTSKRKQFDTYLKDHQMIQHMIAEMVSNTEAARLLCMNAGYLNAEGNQRAVMQISIAKYFASQSAFKIASDAVQIHGASGCSSEYPVQRFLRDAKIMEIVEGSSQIQQMIISRHAYSKSIRS